MGRETFEVISHPGFRHRYVVRRWIVGMGFGVGACRLHHEFFIGSPTSIVGDDLVDGSQIERAEHLDLFVLAE